MGPAQPPTVLVKTSCAERSGCGQHSFLSSFPVLKLMPAQAVRPKRRCNPVKKRPVRVTRAAPCLLFPQRASAQHLEWLRTVKESHGSVELSSLSLAAAINSRGIYVLRAPADGQKVRLSLPQTALLACVRSMLELFSRSARFLSGGCCLLSAPLPGCSAA